MTALVLLQYGTAKLFGFPVSRGSRKRSRHSRCTGIAGVIELVFGMLLLIGLFTRFAAFILSGEMAFAYFIDHAPKEFFPLAERRQLAGALLLRLPLPRVRRRRAVEHRRAVETQQGLIRRSRPHCINDRGTLMEATLDKYRPQMLSILRIMAGVAVA